MTTPMYLTISANKLLLSKQARKKNRVCGIQFEHITYLIDLQKVHLSAKRKDALVNNMQVEQMTYPHHISAHQ